MNRFLNWLLPMLLLATGFPAPAQADRVLPVPDEIYAGHQMVEDWHLGEAEAYVLKLLKQYPESGDVHFLRAKVEFFKGNYEYASKILKHVASNQGEVRDFKELVENTRSATSKFIAQESAHFIFRVVDGPDRVLLPFAEEVLEKSYAILGDLLRMHPQDKIIVEFYPGQEPFSKVSPLTLKDITTSGTVALCKYNRILAISPRFLVRGYNWMDTLSHEFVHYLLTIKSRNHFPLWLHEGVAKYLETRWRNEKNYLSPLMETVLAGGLERDYLIPLENMMPSLAKLKTAEDVQLAYAQVSTMMEYLAELKGEELISDLLDDLAGGSSFEEALASRIGMDLGAFQARWKEQIKKKNLKAIPGHTALLFRFKSDLSAEEEDKDYGEIQMKRTRDLVFLADILNSRNRPQAAVVEYKKAIQETQTLNPILYNKLALTYINLKQYPEAETLLKESLGYYPMFHTTLLNLGELYLATSRLEQARTYFEQAVKINPFNPFAHARLIDTFQRLGLKKEKELQAGLYRYIQ